MSNNSDYLKELNRKHKQEKKKRKRQQLLQEAENVSLNNFDENPTAIERVTAMETSEKVAPLLELDDNDENLYKPKDRLHKRKKAKDKSGEFTYDMQSQQMQELTEDQINKDKHSRKKRKHRQRDEQLENNEVTCVEDCEIRKEHKKKQRLNKTENDSNLCEESNNNSQIKTPPEMSEQTQKSHKRKKPEENKDEHKTNKRKKQLDKNEVTDNKYCEIRKEHQKEQHLKEAENDTNLCEASNNSSQIITPPATSEQTQKSRKRKKPKDSNNTDSTIDILQEKLQRQRREYHRRYRLELCKDPVRKEQYVLKKRERDRRRRYRRKLDGNNTDSTNTDSIIDKIQRRPESGPIRDSKNTASTIDKIQESGRRRDSNNTDSTIDKIQESGRRRDSNNTDSTIDKIQESGRRRDSNNTDSTIDKIQESGRRRDSNNTDSTIDKIQESGRRRDSNNTDSTIDKKQREREYFKQYVEKIRQDPVRRVGFYERQRERSRRYREKLKNMNEGGNAKRKRKPAHMDDPAKAEERLARRNASARRAYAKNAAKRRDKKKSASNDTKASIVLEHANEIVDGWVKSPIADDENEMKDLNVAANETKHLNVANSRPINNIPVRRKAKNRMANFTIDSTASVPSLLGHFERKNKPLIWIYRRLLAKVTAKLATTRSHYLIAGLPLNTFADDFNGCLPSGYFEKFAYKCTMPTITTRLKNLLFKDPVTAPMSVKRDWKSDVFYSLRHTQDDLERTQKRNDKVYTTTEHLVKVTMLMDKDPDPYFNDDYNWYFAGNGNLHAISVNEADCLLHSQLTRLFLSKFSRRKLLTKNKPLISYDCGDGNNIFETICNSNNFVVLRLKHKVHILKLTTADGELTFQNIKDIDSKLPFTSIQFDDFQKNILYITKLDGTLCIVNLDLMKSRTLELMKGASLENNWNKVIALDQVSFCHVSRNCVRIFDKRTNSVVFEFSDLKSKHSERQCDEITAIIKCEDAPFVYLVTSHFMFLMDLRWQGDYKPRLVRRWTHQMQNVPAYISQIKHDINKDFVCISSQWPEDSVLITSDTDICNGIELPTSITLPYSLPTFESTLDAAKNRMLCVDIYHPLEQRIYTAVTGNCIMSADDNVIILTLNSLGDIFAYTLYPEHLDRDDDSLERLHRWSSTMTREKIIHECCSVIDISHIWKALKQVPSDRVLGGCKLLRKELKFSEQVVQDIVDSGEIDGALLDAWIEDEKQTTKVDEKSLNIDLHFSDSE